MHDSRFSQLPASAAATTTTAASTASTASSTASTTAIATAVATASAGALSLWTSLVDVERAAVHLRPIEGSDSLLSIFSAGHFHKAETARAAGVAVGHNAHPIHLPIHLEHLTQLVFRRIEIEVANENILQAIAL
jgi:hypothetical protein